MAAPTGADGLRQDRLNVANIGSARITLNTSALTAYDWSDAPCAYFYATADGQVDYTTPGGSTSHQTVFDGVPYFIQCKTIVDTSTASINACW
jgi:hypothetical protein